MYQSIKECVLVPDYVTCSLGSTLYTINMPNATKIQCWLAVGLAAPDQGGCRSFGNEPWPHKLYPGETVFDGYGHVAKVYYTRSG